MSEEQEGGNSIKNILIGLVSTITVGVGGYITNKLSGEDEAKTEVAAPAPAPVINITQNQTNQQKQTVAPASNKTVIIKEKTVPALVEKKKENEEEPW